MNATCKTQEMCDYAREEGKSKVNYLAKQWLEEHGMQIKRGEDKREYVKRLWKFVQSSKGFWSEKPDPKKWAKDIVAKHESGEVVRPLFLKMAREALNPHGLDDAVN